MNIEISVPSKTFLVGEYSVLGGGPALVAATEPRFQVILSAPGDGRAPGLHPKSPAGLWIRSHSDQFKKIDFEFIDPHQGAGGFGASSAQFLLAWIWTQLESTPFVDLASGVDLEQLWMDFRNLFESDSCRPSGADVLAQANGGLTYLHFNPLKAQALNWVFDDMDFLIVPTGNKMQTHHHLSTLKKEGLDELKEISAQAFRHYKSQDNVRFISSIHDFSQALEAQGKTCQQTLETLKKWNSHPGVLASKGCGALGADSFVLFVEKSETMNVRKKLIAEESPVLASSLSLSSGLSLKMDLKGESKALPMKSHIGSL